MITVKNIRRIAGNKIISVTYKKKDGTVSKMACRFHVSKGVKGKGSSYNPEERNYAIVYKMQGKKSGFRTIIVDNIISVKIKGKELTRTDINNVVIHNSIIDQITKNREKNYSMQNIALTVFQNPRGLLKKKTIKDAA
jgi:hypothetical protein